MVAKALAARLAAVLLGCLLVPGAASAETRVALVVGDGTYQNAPGLNSPRPDADAMAASLTRLGFSVTKIVDANFDGLRRALLSFGREARTADMAVVYYSGHGLEMNGENWLIPVDAELKSDIDVDNEAISLHSAMQTVSSARTLGLVILDSCRQNPFLAKMQRSSQTRDVDRGLARVEPVNNVLVAFAAKDGTISDADAGGHSPFTKALLNNIETPGLEINFLFRNVRDDVLEQTHHMQEPFLYGSLSEQEIYLKPSAETSQPASQTNAMPPVAVASIAPEISADEIAWSYLRHSTEPTTLKGFVEEFPSSVHVSEARLRIASLETAHLSPDATAQLQAQPDEISWSILSESSNPAALRHFLVDFPTSAYAAAARARIDRLERLAAQQAINQTPPKGAAAATARTAHQASATAPAVEKERPVARRFHRVTPEVEKAWKVVRNAKDPAILLAFSEDFPTKHHRVVVQQKVAGYGVEHARSRRVDDQYYVGECDRLASDPRDASRPSGVSGTDYGHLDARHAVTVCHQAILRHPQLARLKYELCRSLVKLGDARRASQECKAAAELAKANGDPGAKLYGATEQAIGPLAAAEPAPAADPAPEPGTAANPPGDSGTTAPSAASSSIGTESASTSNGSSGTDKAGTQALATSGGQSQGGSDADKAGTAHERRAHHGPGSGTVRHSGLNNKFRPGLNNKLASRLNGKSGSIHPHHGLRLQTTGPRSLHVNTKEVGVQHKAHVTFHDPARIKTSPGFAKTTTSNPSALRRTAISNHTNVSVHATSTRLPNFNVPTARVPNVSVPSVHVPTMPMRFR
jgi:hypothetical protein